MVSPFKKCSTYAKRRTSSYLFPFRVVFQSSLGSKYSSVVAKSLSAQRNPLSCKVILDKKSNIKPVPLTKSV